MRFVEAATRGEAGLLVSDFLENSIATAFDAGKRARLGLSGGASPAQAYRALAGRPLPWSKVDIIVVDERWVEIGDEGSNEALLTQCFKNTEVKIFGLKSRSSSPAAGAIALETRLKALRPLDGVLLGMGVDGHTASWFEGALGVDEALDPFGTKTLVAINATTSPIAVPWPHRVTMTLPAIAEAPAIAVLIFGEEKRSVLETAGAASPIGQLVAACFDRLTVFWAC